MQETVQTLTKARDDAADDFETLEGRIARARLDGDERALKRLRAERDAALRDADEANDAIDLARRAETREAEAAAEAERERIAQEVERVRAERIEAAAGVDEALVALEAATARYQVLGRELGALTRSSSAIARKESQNMRWAIWRAGERAAELLCVPFANGARRRTMVELEKGGWTGGA